MAAREFGYKRTGRTEDTYCHLQERRSRLPEVRYREAEVIDLEKRRGTRDGPTTYRFGSMTGSPRPVLEKSIL